MSFNRNVAFIVCVYNGDNSVFLRESLDSIYSQKLPKCTGLKVYLHVDGDVGEDIESVIKQYPIYKLLRSKKNVGLAKGLNKLIDSLEDEAYIFRMDSDDLCRPNRVIEQINFMDSNGQVDFCGGSISEFIKDKSNAVTTRQYPENMARIVPTFLTSSPFAHVTICFRGDFFSKFGDYPVEFPLNEDIAYWLMSLKGGAIGANVNKVLVDVRMDDAYSRRTTKKAYNELRVFWAVAQWQRKGYVYPVLRFLFRFLPTRVVKYVYNSKFRTLLLEKESD
ncbi:glycosyltransferase [Shewanella spartinae]|uniref:glycosyltransferase n=1 Tax=Shewanella spartinae TaxID=2864205 RepID=UPI001C65E81F|nr:glycosyltransferase [Shewanella spartinae]QYJ95160.1 glycosyltransferase [Shewanella spartinae]